MDNSITKRNDPSALLRIGIITDAHYAHGRRFEGTRLCDLSLKKIRAIYQALPPVDALFNLGDLINAVENEAENKRNICEALVLCQEKAQNKVSDDIEKGRRQGCGKRGKEP